MERPVITARTITELNRIEATLVKEFSKFS